MQLIVKNFRGIKDAIIKLDKIALVAGMNGAGKSSIAQGAAAVLSGSPVPLVDFKKKDARQLVTDGQKTGFAILGEAKVTFPNGTFTGQGPRSSLVAAGLSHPLDMKSADATKYLGELLKADPVHEDLAAALPELNEATIGAIWKAITERGWDAAHQQSKETGTKLKGQWEMVTGTRYGSQRSANWVPPEFEFDGVPDLEELNNDLEGKQAGMAALVANIAISADRIEQAQVIADTLPALRDNSTIMYSLINGLNAERVPAVARWEAAIDAAAALTDPGDEVVTAQCPCCSELLVVVSSTQLKKAGDAPDPAAVELQHQAIIDAGQEVAEHRAVMSEIDNRIKDANFEHLKTANSIKNAKQAEEFIAESNTTGATDEDIAAYQVGIDDIQYLIAQLDNMASATKKHNSILQSIEIVAALAPEGVRKAVLLTRLAEVNESLGKLCAVAKYPAVELNDGLEFTLGGRAFNLLSESEQYRIRIISQLLFSNADGSELVIIDRADLLDSPARSGLLKVVKSTGKMAIVCMTISKRSDVPALPDSLGRSYWVEDGVCVDA